MPAMLRQNLCIVPAGHPIPASVPVPDFNPEAINPNKSLQGLQTNRTPESKHGKDRKKHLYSLADIVR